MVCFWIFSHCDTTFFCNVTQKRVMWCEMHESNVDISYKLCLCHCVTCMIMWENEVPMFYTLYPTYVWSCEKMKFPCFIHCTRHMYDHVRKWSSHVLYTVHDTCMIMWENEVPMFYTLYTTYVWSCEKMKFLCFIHCTRHMYDHVRKWISHVLYTVHNICMTMWENEVPMFYTLYTIKLVYKL